MKHLLSIVILFQIVLSKNSLNSYELLKETILRGEQVKGVVNFGQCTPHIGNQIISLDVTIFQYFNDRKFFGEENIKFSFSNIVTRKGDYAWEYSAASIYPNGTVFLNIKESKADFSPIIQLQVTCQLGDPQQIYFKSVAQKKQVKICLNQNYENLKNYEDVKEAFLDIRPVRAILEIEKCYSYKGPFGDIAPKTIQGWNANIFEILSKDDEELVYFTQYGMIQNFMKPNSFLYNLQEIKIFQNNTFFIQVHGIDASTFKEYFTETIYCEIFDGLNDGAIKIYS